MSRGKVIAGDYKNYEVVSYGGRCYFEHLLNSVSVNRNVISRYEIVSNIEKHPFWGTLVKGLIGKTLFGTIGAASAMSTSMGRKVYIISIEFKNGKRSLIEVPDVDYKSILQALY